MTHAISAEQVTPFLARMKKFGLKVAIVHAGGPAPGANRVIAGAAKQFIDRSIPVIGFINGYEFIQKLPPQDLRPKKHFIEIDEEVAGFFKSSEDVNKVLKAIVRSLPKKSAAVFFVKPIV